MKEKMKNTIKWINTPKNIKDYIGFCYKITCLKNNKSYFGKKLFWFKTIKRVKCRTNNKKTKRVKELKESDWENYWSSSNKLKEDVKKYGKENFIREIISWHKTKFDLSYAELLLQIKNNVLFDESYYNEIVSVRLRKAK